MGRYCGEEYDTAPLPSQENDFHGHHDYVLDEAVRRRDALTEQTGLDWRVIVVAFGYRVDRGHQAAAAPWLTPSGLVPPSPA